MRRWDIRGFRYTNLALAIMFALGCSIALDACAYWPKVANVAVDLAPCIMDEYHLVRDAIQDPGKAETYLSIIGELLHCAPAVIRDLESGVSEAARADAMGWSSPSPVLLANKEGTAYYTSALSKESARRIRVVKLLMRGLRSPPIGD